MRNYSELRKRRTYLERFEYLKLNGAVAAETFGHERWLNQKFYRSYEWKNIRTHVIARDLGCDLGVQGHDIVKQIHVHHMNPVARVDLYEFNEDILNPEYLISVSHGTHNAIHYGDDPPGQPIIVERMPNDTIPWRRFTNVTEAETGNGRDGRDDRIYNRRNPSSR